MPFLILVTGILSERSGSSPMVVYVESVVKKSGTTVGFSQNTSIFFIIIHSRALIIQPYEATAPVDSIPYHSHRLIKIIHRI